MRKKRLMAFLMDIFFVLLLTTILSRSYIFNPYVYDYQEESKNYYQIYESTFEEEQVDEEKLEELSEALYNLELFYVYYYLYYLIFVIIYFVIFQYLNKGQTLGKKIFKVRVVDLEENNPHIGNYFIRYIFMGSISIMGYHLVLIFKVIMLFCNIGHKYYLRGNMFLTILGLTLELLLIISLIKENNNQLFHDRIARTKVVKIN